MRVHLNREVKTYCPDFKPIRRPLGELDATLAEVKEQVDFFYRLPSIDGTQGGWRLRLRVEDGRRHLIYYYDRKETDARTSQFQLWEVHDPKVKEMLDTALGVRVVVKKLREQWRKENVLFNLDVVDDVGQIFEIEAMAEAGRDITAQVEEYHRRFAPYLGSFIAGSNEDLVEGLLK